MKVLSPILLGLFSFFTTGAPAQQNVPARQFIYVSPKGNDEAAGSLAQPLKSFYAALQKVAGSSSTKVSILFRAGKYPQEQLLEITPAVLAGHSLDIAAYREEHVVITGSTKITARWSVWKGPILQTFAGKGLSIDQLFCNGQVLTMARYPNAHPGDAIYHGTASDAIAPARVKDWADPAGGYLHAMHANMWGSYDFLIKGKDDSGRLRLTGGWQNNRPAPIHPRYRFVENIFEELDAPGEWFYNATTGILYLYPPQGVDPATALFERTVLGDLIHIRGDGQQPVKQVHISGIDLSETDRTFMLGKEPLQRSDWTIYRGASILFEGTEDCGITDCNFYGIGGNAILFSGYNKRDTVSGCHISHIGASAVAFIGDSSAVRSPYSSFDNYLSFDRLDRSSGPRSQDYPEACVVSDCLLNNLGEIEKQATGVEIQMSAGIIVRHNTIYNTPRAGINIGDGRWGGHIIEYNDVFNTVLETGDHGSFNSWGRDRFWAPDRKYMDSLVAVHPELILLDALQPVTIRNNRFRCDHGWDIDLDDGSTNYRIYDNICLNGGLKLREGFYREVYNNVLINNSFHPHVWFENSHDKFTHNIVMRSYAPIGINYWGDQVDSNLFADTADLLAARANGTDAGSVAGNPLFLRPESGDYKVAASSPAFRIGFVNFAMDDFGVRKPSLKRVALSPVIPTLVWNARERTRATIVLFKGSRLKPVEGLGERSAYGLPDERGLIVVSVGAGTLLARSGVLDKDVIRTVDGQPVSTVSELEERLKASKSRDKIEIYVIRNQKSMHIFLAQAR